MVDTSQDRKGPDKCLLSLIIIVIILRGRRESDERGLVLECCSIGVLVFTLMAWHGSGYS